MNRRLHEWQKPEKATRERAQLSQREREIIVLIAQGYKNKEIAEKMFITEQTVKNHLHNVFDKLGVSDRLGTGALRDSQQFASEVLMASNSALLSSRAWLLSVSRAR